MFSHIFSQRRHLRLLMPGICILLMSAALRVSAQSQADAPRLFINNGGHTGVVRQVLYTPDGKNMISVGDDKAIRIWDAVKGKEIGPPIYGQVSDDANSDKLYCAALGPQRTDGTRLLAVAGSTHIGLVNRQDSTKNLFVIRLFELKSIGSEKADASLVALLPSGDGTLGHTDLILGLAFSPDGRRLASCSADWTARVWDPDNGKCIAVLGGGAYYRKLDLDQPRKHVISGVAWSPQGNRIVTASKTDGTIRIWNPDSQDGSDPLDKTLAAGGEVNCLAWSGKMIVAGTKDAGGGGAVVSWDTDHLDKDSTVIGREDKPILCIAVSPDGKMIAAGQNDTKPHDICQVLLWSSTGGGGFQELSSDQSHPIAVTAVTFSPDSTQVASADAIGNIFLANLQDRSLPVQKLVGAGAPTENVRWSPDQRFICWTSGGPDYIYNFANTICEEANRSDAPKDAAAWPGAKLTVQREGRTLRLEEAPDFMSITVKGGDHDIIIPSPQERDAITAFTFTHDGNGVIVGTLRNLYFFDLTASGQETKEFIGHSAEITSVAVSADGQYLASTSNDQTVQIWNLGGSAERVAPFLSIFASMDDLGMADLRYVVWAERGFYTSSANGQNIIGWQRNKGDAKEADYDSAGDLFSLQNTDVIKSVWKEKGDIAQAMSDAGVGSDRSVQNSTLPTVALHGLTDGQSFSTQQISVSALVTPAGQPLDKVVFSVNGVPIDVSASGTTASKVFSQTITLRKGTTNLVSVTAVDALGNHQVAKADVICTVPPDPPHKPRLHLLAIGVRRYAKFLDLKYPDRDAKAIKAALTSQKGRLFGDVTADVLVNQHATHDAIIQHINDLCEANQSDDYNDYTIVFVAAHGGQTDPQHYYLLPFDLDSHDKDSVTTTAIDWDTIYQQLRHLRGHVLLLLDTCHSAGATTAAEQAQNDQEAKANTDAFHTFTNHLYEDNTVQISNLLVLTSCGPSEVSQEGGISPDSKQPIQHGLFTQALIEGLRLDNNPIIQKQHPSTNTVTLQELVNYVVRYVQDGNSDQTPCLLGDLTNETNYLPMVRIGPDMAQASAAPTQTASR